MDTQTLPTTIRREPANIADTALKECIERKLATFVLTFNHHEDSEDYILEAHFRELRKTVEEFLQKQSLSTLEEIFVRENGRAKHLLFKFDCERAMQETEAELYRELPAIASRSEIRALLLHLNEICRNPRFRRGFH